MSLDLSALNAAPRLLFAIPLQPLQGKRFQPTGFPNLGAGTFQTQDGLSVLVESPQSMANWLELTIWDGTRQDVKPALEGLSHVKVLRNGAFLTDTILESHRLNSPYLLEGSDRTFIEALKSDLGGLETGPINRNKLAEALLKHDVGSLLHGVFLAKKELSGGRLRVARSLSAFIEADGARVAPSGGVKNDHVNPSGDTGKGYGNVPFARDEFTADAITLYVNLDLSQIRGYGLGTDVERLLVVLALYKLRTLLGDGLRLRTACDFAAATETIAATLPTGFALPELSDLSAELRVAIDACKSKMQVGIAHYNDELKKGKDKSGDEASTEQASEDDNNPEV